MSDPRPASPGEIIQRARRLLLEPSNATSVYAMGAGDYRPLTIGGVRRDLPWTPVDDFVAACDCAGFLNWCLKTPRHRPGYNRGAWATVSDDANPNSWIEDADHDEELMRRVAAPMLGDILAYKTFTLHGMTQPFIGHCAVVVGIDRAGDWDPARPAYNLLDIVQVCGGEGRKPAAIATDGSAFAHHDATWPVRIRLAGMGDQETPVSVRTVMLRAVP